MASTPRSPRARFTARPAAWLDRWGSIVPLLAAEFIVWLGFGALLPVLPLYFEEQGIDLATLGLVIAAWPAARLVGEPVFGWLADRTARVPIMVVGLVATGIFTALPLVLTGPLAFILLRAAAGLSTAAYDPAARGFLTDATEPARRGEAFGLYGAAQMGGLLFGPAIGAFGAALAGRQRVRLRVLRRGIARRGRRDRPDRSRGPAADPDASGTPPRPRRTPARGPRTARRRRRSGRRRSVEPLEPGPHRCPDHQRRWLLRERHVRGHLEPVPQEPGRRPRPDRADVRDVRAADPAPVADRRPIGRPARGARVHRARLDRAVRRGHRLHADLRPAARGSADPDRGDRLRVPQPCALLGGRGEQPCRAGRRPRRACSGRRGRSGSSWRR